MSITAEQMQGGRAFPEAIDGTPANYQERERMNNDDGEKEIIMPVQGDELNREIVEACQEIIDWKTERSEINHHIQAVYKRMESKGIPAKAFKACLANM